MSLSRNRFVLTSLALLTLAFLVGCGSSSPSATPPPTGGFSNTNLNGTYAFSTSGADANGAYIAFAGAFNANGSGQITGGTLDVVDPEFSPIVTTGMAITGGSYGVGVDGRPKSGSGLLNLTTSSGTFTFDFVISSTSGGLITYFDNGTFAGSGSGSFALQSTVAQSNVDSQSYTFNVGGLSASGSTAFAMVGSFTLDANGNVSVGVADVNNGNISTCSTSTGCGMTSGGLTISSTAGTPGSFGFFSSAINPTFDVYPVDATHLKFIETDGVFYTTGDAYTQSSSVPSGNNVFAVAGVDSSAAGPFAAVGLLVTDGGGNITNSSTEDINDAYAGTTGTPLTGFTGTYSTVTGGRATMTLNGFDSGLNGLGCGNCEFAIYPSTGGMQILEIDNAGFTSGTSYQQGSSPTLASGTGYGMNIAGSNIFESSEIEEDDIAEFTNTSGTLTGLIDFNDQGSTTFNPNGGYSASYAADSSGIAGRGLVTSGNNNSYDMATYVVDGSTAFGTVIDSGIVGMATISTQASTAADASAAKRTLTVLQLAKHPAKAAKLKRKIQK
jgi:hypothetical protein